MSEYSRDPTQEYRQVRKGEWLRLDFRALVLDFLWPDTGGEAKVEYPLRITHRELQVLAKDIGLGEFFVPPGKLIGEVTTAFYGSLKSGRMTMGFDHETSFTVDDQPSGIVLELGREAETGDLYVGFRSYYARGEFEITTEAQRERDEREFMHTWEAWQAFGYALHPNKQVEGYVTSRVFHRGQITYDGGEYIAVDDDDSGLRYLVERGKAIYATLGESKEQPHAA